MGWESSDMFQFSPPSRLNDGLLASVRSLSSGHKFASFFFDGLGLVFPANNASR